jgi:hypothetical protein
VVGLETMGFVHVRGAGVGNVECPKGGNATSAEVDASFRLDGQDFGL